MNLSNTIYYGISHLYNKRRLFLVSVTVMVVGIVLIYNTLFVYFMSYSDIAKERKLLGDARDDLYMIKNTYYTLDFSYYDTYKDFLLRMKKDYNIGIYDAANCNVSGSFDDKTLDMIIGRFPDMNIVSGKEVLFPILRIDNCLINSLGFVDENGNSIELHIDEYGREEIAVGYELRPYVNIGDELINSLSNTVYVVKYILADNQVWTDGELLNCSNIVSLDDYFITPLDLERCNSFECASFSNSVFLCVNSEDDGMIDTKINSLREEARKSGVFIDIGSMNQMEKQSLRNQNDEFRFCLLLAGIMIATVTIIVIILSVLSWVSDYHDIGILYANGFSNKDIFRTIIIENSFKLIVSALFSVSWICIRGIGRTFVIYEDSVYSRIVYAVIVLVYIAVLFISSVISYALINRASPTNLLKGEEL